MQQLIDQLIAQQKNNRSNIATIGFDGFIDSIVKLVKTKDSNGNAADYFSTMASWGNYILNKNAGNFSVELQQQTVKSGGNMPNMSSALSALGVSVNCIGAMGYPVIDPLFSKLPAQCKLHSFAPAGGCQAIEFDDGKIMLSSMEELNKVDWNILKERIPIATLIEIYNDASLIGMLNWGELSASTSFWNGLLKEVLPFCNNTHSKIFFVDLSDCSNRTAAETKEALQLLNNFSRYGKVILSLNHNESVFIHNVLFEPVNNYNDAKVFAEKLFNHITMDTLIIHNRNKAVAVRKNESAESNSFIIESPKLLTGAGDNFNAGFCFAQLMDCSMQDSLLMAHLTAAHYIKNGESANLDDIITALKIV